MQKTHKQLFFMIAIFAFPIILSGLLFHYHTYFHLKTSNHGTLIRSPIDATYLYSTQQHQWHVVYVCDTQCEQTHHQLQQVKKALGKDSDRVAILLLEKKEPSQKLQTALAANQKNPSFVVNHKIYLVDPLGNLFMYYPEDVNLMNVLKDLQHVLEVSQIG